MKCDRCERTGDPVRDPDWRTVTDSGATVPLLECSACGNRQYLQ